MRPSQTPYFDSTRGPFFKGKHQGKQKEKKRAKSDYAKLAGSVGLRKFVGQNYAYSFDFSAPEIEYFALFFSFFQIKAHNDPLRKKHQVPAASLRVFFCFLTPLIGGFDFRASRYPYYVC